MDIEKRLLTVRETSAATGLGRSKLYQLIAAGELRSVLIGRSRRVAVEDLTEFVEKLRCEDLDDESA